MEFGIFDHVDQPEQPLAQMYNERMELLRAAETNGFRGYHVAEHHSTPVGMAPSPSVYLAAVARETKHIRIGPMVYLLPMYHPLRLIEEICMLDHLSHGRLEVGVGRGISPIELGMFGIDAQETPAIFAEALEVILAGLSHDTLTHQGKYFQYQDIPMTLKPLQDPIPLWSASMSPDGQVLAAKHGMHNCTLGNLEMVKGAAEHYATLWEQHKDDPLRPLDGPQQPLIGAYRQVIIADTDALADKLAPGVYHNFITKLLSLRRAAGLFSPFYDDLGLEDFEVARDAGMIVVGSPNRVADQLRQQAQQCNFNYLLAQIAFGNLTHAQAMCTLEHFTTTVMPALRS